MIIRLFVAASMAFACTSCASDDGAGEDSGHDRDARSQNKSSHATTSTPPTPSTRPTPDAASVRAAGECFGKPATAVGTPGDDMIQAGRGRDVIISLAGNDHIMGLRGRDVACTGPGADLVEDVGTIASPGCIDGGFSSAIRVDTGPGDDQVSAGTAFKIYTGAGNDTLTVSHQTLLAYLGTGDDRVVSAGTGVDFIHLGGGNDTVANTCSRAEAAMRTCVMFEHETTDVRVNLVRGTAVSRGQHPVRVRLRGIHCVWLGGGHNIVHGTPDPDTIVGRFGTLTVHAGGSRDQIGGGPEDDRIFAGDGRDSASGGGGNDVVHGGPGGDFVGGDAGDDRLYGDEGGDGVEGLDGADLLVGGPGGDTMYAGSECDEYVQRGRGGLVDSEPNDLFGGEGNDYLGGDKGPDRLDGGNGNDKGTGGWKDAGDNTITSVETLYPGCGMDY